MATKKDIQYYNGLKEVGMFVYRITTQHDRGKANFKVVAPDKESAIEMVMGAECCPRCAIVKIENLSTKICDLNASFCK